MEGDEKKILFHVQKGLCQAAYKKQKGKCGVHGCCEAQPRMLRCKFIKGKKCLVWNTDKMPLRCKLYPFDEKDKSPFSKKHCNFHWDKN